MYDWYVYGHLISTSLEIVRIITTKKIFQIELKILNFQQASCLLDVKYFNTNESVTESELLKEIEEIENIHTFSNSFMIVNLKLSLAFFMM